MEFLSRLRDLWDWANFLDVLIKALQTWSGFAAMGSLIAMVVGGFAKASGYEIGLMGIGVFCAVNLYGMHKILKIERAFKFVFEPTDDRFVRSDGQKTDYFFGLHIAAKRTVDFPEVWALHGPFADRMFIARDLSSGHPSRDLLFYKGGAIDKKTHRNNLSVHTAQQGISQQSRS